MEESTLVIIVVGLLAYIIMAFSCYYMYRKKRERSRYVHQARQNRERAKQNHNAPPISKSSFHSDLVETRHASHKSNLPTRDITRETPIDISTNNINNMPSSESLNAIANGSKTIVDTAKLVNGSPPEVSSDRNSVAGNYLKGVKIDSNEDQGQQTQIQTAELKTFDINPTTNYESNSTFSRSTAGPSSNNASSSLKVETNGVYSSESSKFNSPISPISPSKLTNANDNFGTKKSFESKTSSNSGAKAGYDTLIRSGGESTITKSIRNRTLNFDTSTMRGNTITFGAATTMVSGNALALPGFLMMLPDVDYTVGEKIAEGGGGALYTGTLKKNLSPIPEENIVVIKILKDREDASLDDNIAAFNQEVSIMYLLSHSRNVVKLLGFNESPPTIVIKYYPCGTLEDLIDSVNSAETPSNKKRLLKRKQWTPHRVLSFCVDIASGLNDIHEAGILHNDIKPSNIFIEREYDGQLLMVIADFGVSAVIDSNLLRVKAYRQPEIKGASISYAAPEILIAFLGEMIEEFPGSEKLKARDIYSYSMVVYEILTRKTPWAEIEDMMEVVNRVTSGGRPPVPREIVQWRNKDAILDAILSIMEKSWAHNPLERPSLSSTAEFLRQKLAEFPEK